MIELRVDFALLLHDEFNGTVVQDRGIVFYVNRRNIRPMRKPEGYYVFQGLEEDDFLVEIAAPHYLEHSVRITRGALSPTDPVVRIRLDRSGSGVFRDCEWIAGNAPPNRTVCAFLEQEPTALQSRITTENGVSSLALGYSVQRRAGRRFAVGRMGAAETFVITGETQTTGIYTTADTLRRTYDKGSPVMRTYSSRSGPDGGFQIPVDAGVQPKLGKVYYEEAGKWVSV